MVFLVAALCVAALAFLIIMLVVSYFRAKELDFYRRLSFYEEGPSTAGQHQGGQAQQLVQQMAKPLGRFDIIRKLDAKMWRAGLPFLGSEFIVIAVLGSVVLGMLAWFLSLDPKMGILAGVLGLVFAWGFVGYRVQERKRRFMEQLGDCLTTVANALRAGYSFQQAMTMVAEEMEPPISQEFGTVNMQVAMGVQLDEALEDMNKRVESPDFDMVVAAVLIQREVGGNLAQILDTISETINERIRMKREINTLTAQGRFSAIVLLMLPIALAAAMYVINKDQIMLLFTNPQGRIAVAGAVVLEVIGYFVIKKIVDIET